MTQGKDLNFLSCFILPVHKKFLYKFLRINHEKPKSTKIFLFKISGSVIHTIHERINLLLTSKLDKLKIHFCLLKFFFY